MKGPLLCIIAALCPVFAQNGAIPANVGYTEPSAFQAAPGQVVTLFLYGIPFGADGRFRSAQAPDGDLPTNLAGISVRITQADSSSVPAAIFAVRQQSLCGLSGIEAGDPTCLLTAVKVQFPYELAGDLVVQDQKSYTYALPAQLSIDVDGRLGRFFPLQPLPDNGHILTTCDATWDTKTSSVCDRLVYHHDGSVVTAQSPANVGETVYVLYYGLGRTNPAVATGKVSPAGAAVTELVPNYPRVILKIDESFLNVPSSTPRQTFNPETANTIPVPIASATLLPGQIGVYQVSFTIPIPKGPVIDCGGEVRSNSMLMAATLQGVESIGLCVRQ